MIRRFSDRLLRPVALALAVAMALPAPAHANQDPLAHAKELYDEGSTLYSAADYAGAIEKFTQALKIVTAEGSDDDHTIRGALLLNIAQSHIHAYDVDAAVGHLRAARSIYQRFTDEAERGAGYAADDVSQAHQQLADLETRIDELEERAKPVPSEPASPRDDRRDGKEAEIVRTRGVGIGLVVAGGVLTLGGIGLIVWGSTFRTFAIDSVRKEANDPSKPLDEFTAEEQAHVESQTRDGNYTMLAGGLVSAVGAVGIGLGAWQMAKAAKAKKSLEHAAMITPIFGRDFAGLSVRGRF